MKLTKAYLQRMINEEISLHEKAITKTAAQRAGLALYIGMIRDTKYYMLYDPIMFVNICGKSKRNDVKVDNITDVDMASFKEAIYAMISVHPHDLNPYSAATVQASAANKGYGPLLYDIVMANEKGLMSDRDSVSQSARKVWSYYKNKRKDVEAKLIDDEDRPRTKTKKDDGVVYYDLMLDDDDEEAVLAGIRDNPLNYVYVASKKPNIDKLIKNHQRAIDRARAEGMKGTDVHFKNTFYEMASEFFHLKF